ncbi:MAG TPA: hypothetical protein VGO87_09750 [Acidimicrobiia bacterium]|jgi:hypothetical protein
MARAYLTTLVPVDAGREEALRKTLADLGPGDESPFHGLAGTHMTRLYVLDHYGGSLLGPVYHRELTPALLVLTAVVDGEPAAWADRLAVDIGPTVEAVWSHCRGFPGVDDGRAFGRWLLGYAVAPSFAIIPRQDTVERVRSGLDVRARLGGLAARLQGAAPGAVRAAYRQAFDR